uniref:HMG box domain-containing protein n=1 Tax=Parascaris univalens TaxID=6257 RepID=A0A915CEW5_PARUN
YVHCNSRDSMKEGRRENADENSADALNTPKIAQTRCSTAARCRKGVGSGRRSTKKPYRKLLTDENAPKRPHSAYVLFLAMQKRPVGRNRGVSRAEEGMAVGDKWTALSDEQKRPFFERAELERLEYEKLVEEYHKTDAYKRFKEVFEEKKEALIKERRKMSRLRKISGETGSDDEAEDIVGAAQPDGIPIFSSQFIEYNKAQEMALKKLRRKSSSLEEENRLLKENITRLKANIAARKREQHREADHTHELLRTKEKWANVIIGALNGVVISGAPPVSKNIVAYMERLNYLAMEDPQHPVLVKVRAAVSNANFL